MRPFPGHLRRVYITLRHGQAAHLFRRRKAAGAITWCGYAGGSERSWGEVRRRALCRTCVRVSGLELPEDYWEAA